MNVNASVKHGQQASGSGCGPAESGSAWLRRGNSAAYAWRASRCPRIRGTTAPMPRAHTGSPWPFLTPHCFTELILHPSSQAYVELPLVAVLFVLVPTKLVNARNTPWLVLLLCQQVRNPLHAWLLSRNPEAKLPNPDRSLYAEALASSLSSPAARKENDNSACRNDCNVHLTGQSAFLASVLC